MLSGRIVGSGCMQLSYSAEPEDIQSLGNVGQLFPL
jgi:hypothetical protein